MGNARENQPKSFDLANCPKCGATPTQPCINPKTGNPYRHNIGHVARIIQDAEENR